MRPTNKLASNYKTDGCDNQQILRGRLDRKHKHDKTRRQGIRRDRVRLSLLLLRKEPGKDQEILREKTNKIVIATWDTNHLACINRLKNQNDYDGYYYNKRVGMILPGAMLFREHNRLNKANMDNTALNMLKQCIFDVRIPVSKTIGK